MACFEAKKNLWVRQAGWQLVKELPNMLALRVLRTCLMATWVGMGVIAWGQPITRPDAGTLQQQLERDKLPRPVPRAVLPDLQVPAPALDVHSETLVEVKRFKLEGNTLLSEDALSSLLKDNTGRRLSFSELELAAQKVMQAYRDAGWMAYVFLPEQDVTLGEVTLRIVEIVMGELTLRSDAQQLVSESHIRQIFKAHQKQGEALRIAALDRAVLLVGDLPGVIVTPRGLTEDEAGNPVRNVLMDISSAAIASADVNADNAGSRSTGRERVMANLSLNSPMGWGDQALLTAMRSQGSDYLRAEFSWPVGYKGWRASLYDTHLSYRLVAPEFLALNSRGTANTLGLGASYPLLRTDLRNLNAHFSLERKGFDNQVNGATDSQYKSTAIGIGLSGNLSEEQRGTRTMSVYLTRGLLNLNGSPTQSRDAANAQTAGTFEKLRYALTQQHFFSSQLNGYAAFSGQWANKNLDSSEKFTLGGDSGVRAYPGSEGVGAQGLLVNLELRQRVSETNTLVAFYDWGRVMQLRNQVTPNALNTYDLKGAGLAWMLNFPGGMRLKMSLARRIGNNPNPSNTGTDQDGSLIKNRYGFSVNVPLTF